MPRLEHRYAEALLASAQAPDEADAFGEALAEYAGVFEQSEELRAFLLCKTFPAEAKKDALKKLAKPAPPQRLLNLLYLLADRDRLALLPGIAEDYHRLKAEKRKTLLITVYTAMPLGEDEKQRICTFFAKRYGAESTEVDERIDVSLIGGIRVKIGDTLFDASLEGQLRQLQDCIHGE